jgi:hypothetical protein
LLPAPPKDVHGRHGRRHCDPDDLPSPLTSLGQVALYSDEGHHCQ